MPCNHCSRQDIQNYQSETRYVFLLLLEFQIGMHVSIFACVLTDCILSVFLLQRWHPNTLFSALLLLPVAVVVTETAATAAAAAAAAVVAAHLSRLSLLAAGHRLTLSNSVSAVAA